MGSIPRLDRPKPDRLTTIPGRPPSLLDLPPGCAFAPRCAHAHEACEHPVHLEAKVRPDHRDRCVLPAARKAELREPAIHPEQVS
jgi:oligopeptide/dipeptide ABC transporter ATP-binding protein